MKFLVTGARGFLGSRAADLLEERGHEVVRLARAGGAPRAAVDEARLVRADAGDPAVRDLLGDCEVVFHFAGVPDPARARADPARAVRENVGATLNLLEGCAEHGAGLVYPSTLRAALEPPPDEYALSKRLGEEVCRLHRGRATVVRFTSVYGPGQMAWEGATGAIAVFTARALEDAPIVIPGDPQRRRDFLYVDDAIAALERLVVDGRWNETVTIGSGEGTSLLRAAELVREAAASSAAILTPGGDLPPGENESYEAGPQAARIGSVPVEEGIRRYVDWLTSYPAVKGRTGA